MLLGLGCGRAVEWDGVGSGKGGEFDRMTFSHMVRLQSMHMRWLSRLFSYL
jgi:hypothetical protein